MKFPVPPSSRLRRSLLLLMLLGAAPWGVGHAQESAAREKISRADAAATVVVFNDNAPDSEALAKFYAGKRGIAADHLVALRCVTTEDISRSDFERDIATPLRTALKKRGWWKLREINSPQGAVESSKIHFVALMRGVPLRVSGQANIPGDVPQGSPPLSQHNEASVDSEIAALGLFSPSISGLLRNPYFSSYLAIEEVNLPALLLVGRLDAPTADIVRRMITDSLAAEKNGLFGFTYVDARGIKDGGYAEGDRWLMNIARDARKAGSPVILDAGPEIFPPTYPMRDAALYFGWYTANVSGPMARPDFRFPQGAIAVHIHSFSASTVRDPDKAWVAPLLAAGAAATTGNVSEPYLSFTPNLDIFHARLRAGFTFAEAGWMSERALSWMTTFVGDPLYRPFPANSAPGKAPRNAWEAYSAAARIWLDDASAGQTALLAAGDQWKSGLPFEGLGLLQLTTAHPEASLEAFSKARHTYSQRDDILRAALHEIIQLRLFKKPDEALSLTREELQRFPEAPAADLLRGIERELDPPPPLPPPPAK